LINWAFGPVILTLTTPVSSPTTAVAMSNVSPLTLLTCSCSALTTVTKTLYPCTPGLSSSTLIKTGFVRTLTGWSS
jgi:hypothetical protein